MLSSCLRRGRESERQEHSVYVADYEFREGWTIRETRYVPEEETSRATVFALANGYMGLRGAGEELSPSLPGAKGCYVNGIYDTPRGKLTEREFPNIQDWTLTRLSVDGEGLDLATGEITGYFRELDMRRGIMRRHIRWRSPSGVVIHLDSERFLSMVDLHVGVIRWKLSAEQDCAVEIGCAIDANVSNRWADHCKSVNAEADGDALWMSMHTFEPGYEISVATRSVLDGARHVERRSRKTSDRTMETTYAFLLPADEEVTLTRWAAIHDSRFTSGSLREACEADIARAMGEGYDAVRSAHTARWARLWDGSDVLIEGDEDAQMGIRFSVFHLLAAAPYHNDRISIPARGLQGQDYYGSIFWDCEVFVLPLLSYTQPEAARNVLGYRYHTLDGARRKAAGMGYKGAYYAWQSQETGDDQCDLYVFTNPLTGEMIRSYFADEQIHISADIVYAARQYYAATGDESFWVETGAEIAVEVARFFVSRATWNEDKDRYELLSVLGPDEYHERVNNNAFTNAMAREVVRIALQVSALLSERHRDAYARLVEKTGLNAEELGRWREFVRKLYVPEPDRETKLIEQFDGYFALKDEPVEETRKRLAHPDLHPGGPLGPYQETQNIKQADVIMLLYLLRGNYDTETKRANWEYYEKRTAHDSSLSPMAYSLVAADVGMADWAYKYYIYTSHIDLESYGPHWNLGIHAASLGGAWLDIVHGFCQLVLELDGVRISKQPALPPHWNGIQFNFTWHGQPIRYRTDGQTVTLESRGTMDVPVLHPGGSDVLKAGGSVEIAFAAE